MGGDVEGGTSSSVIIETYREVEERSTLKRIARMAVDDVKELILLSSAFPSSSSVAM